MPSRSARKKKFNATKPKTKAKKQRSSCSKFSKEEKQRLRKAVHMREMKDWNDVAKFVGTDKDGRQCNQHWNRVMKPSIKKSAWTEDETQKLLSWAACSKKKCGRLSWSYVAAHLPGRTDIQCRQKYRTMQKPSQVFEKKGKVESSLFDEDETEDEIEEEEEEHEDQDEEELEKPKPSLFNIPPRGRKRGRTSRASKKMLKETNFNHSSRIIRTRSSRRGTSRRHISYCEVSDDEDYIPRKKRKTNDRPWTPDFEKHSPYDQETHYDDDHNSISTDEVSDHSEELGQEPPVNGNNEVVTNSKKEKEKVPKPCLEHLDDINMETDTLEIEEFFGYNKTYEKTIMSNSVDEPSLLSGNSTTMKHDLSPIINSIEKPITHCYWSLDKQESSSSTVTNHEASIPPFCELEEHVPMLEIQSCAFNNNDFSSFNALKNFSHEQESAITNVFHSRNNIENNTRNNGNNGNNGENDTEDQPLFNINQFLKNSDDVKETPSSVNHSLTINPTKSCSESSLSDISQCSTSRSPNENTSHIPVKRDNDGMSLSCEENINPFLSNKMYRSS